jgi:hypothetical protein
LESMFTLIPQREHRQLLALKGSFPPQWPGNLAAGLATLHIGIVSGTARKQGFSWDALFTLDFSRHPGLAEPVDFVALAKTDVMNLPEEPIHLSGYTLRRLPSDELEVTVTGLDQEAFLARLLHMASLMTLFPREFDLDTIGGKIKDRFVFGGAGNMPPTPTVMSTLDTTLRGFTENAASMPSPPS